MKKFTCEKCGHHLVEEVMVEVVQESVIADVEILSDGTLALQYGTTNTEGGEVTHYQCVGCGTEVTEVELRELAEGEDNV